MAAAEIYDLLILTDATASMGHYLRALNHSLPEIIRISSLTGSFDRIGVLAYRDYAGGNLTEWSGWHGRGGTASRESLLAFAASLQANYGGDWPEATKSGLAHAHQVMRNDAKTVMLLFADAPPHTIATKGSNWASERTELRINKFGDDSKHFIDWVAAAKTLRDGDKKAQVFSIIDSHLADTLSLFTFLSTVTGGTCLRLVGTSSEAISKITLGVLLAWMGVAKDGAKSSQTQVATIQGYKDTANIAEVKSEEDENSSTYFVKSDTPTYCDKVKANLNSTSVTIDTLKQFIPRRDVAVVDFSKRYKADEQYRNIVVDQLEEIIKSDVTAVTVNPVFGSLWRTVCNDRQNEARDRLIQAFGREVDRIPDQDKKQRMKAWLEESYDYVGEILAIIEAVKEADRYPCVFLDPTLDFSPPAMEDDADDEPGKSGKFTRDELLEIGRSCDYRILRRLGHVFTMLTYAASEAELPAHIKIMSESEVPRIPTALVESRYQRKFWKILLHTVLQGTMVTARPAALLAALSLRMGMAPLRDAADTELLHFDQWNTLDIPETWNTNCLALLLEADKNYRDRIISSTTKSDKQSLLNNDDRRLFQALVDYKLLEMNLGTTLTAHIGWRPEKTKVRMGPMVVCTGCSFPRSVTIMGANGVCGMCDKEACRCPDQNAHEAAVHENVSKDDAKETKATWVECSMVSCRAQYVVYRPALLNVRPKCHYCRAETLLPKNHPDRESRTIAPCVECKKCLSRIIWPEQYRPADFNARDFQCPACDTGNMATIVDHETTAKEMAEDNGTAWLLRNDKGKIAEPFNGRSLFYTISTAGTAGFADAVEVLPTLSTDPAFHIRGKLVRNAGDLLVSLRSWIDARRTEAGTCSLCFSAKAKRSLRPACGRSGCAQAVCANCAAGWYGLNTPGRVINVAALACPFCRRRPAPRGSAVAVARDLRALGGLADAVNDAGSWIYAWCAECGFAKRFVERACAAGPPPELQRWRCDDCVAKKDTKKDAIKECPGCKTPTQKTGGCNHITCTVDGCGTHWCYTCGQGMAQDVIYTHMTQEHGGIYDYEGGAADESDYDTDEYQ